MIISFLGKIRIDMPEDQNIEWKLTWKDEYLKWICGFANAQGGRIYIGVDDNGNVVGVRDYKRLMEDIPNKVQMYLGIVVDVNLLEDYESFYIEINVPPSSYAVNYKGEYHYRSGSTKQQLKGEALTDFLLRKTGRQFRWDAVPEPDYTVEELDFESFSIFRREAKHSGRITESDLMVDNAELLSRLGLMTKGELKRAAVLLFYRHPEEIVSGCYVKIGKFGKGSDLIHHEEIRGSLFVMAERIMEVLYLKYLTATISYDGNTRVERYPYPPEAIRETIYNALIHCDWSAGYPIQIRIDENSLRITNVGKLPYGWTQETLTSYHHSKPFNPDIARVFFRAGWVETWGRGIKKVCEACEAYGTPLPTYSILGEDVTVVFEAPLQPTEVTEIIEEPVSSSFSLTEQKVIKELKKNPNLTQIELATILHVSKTTIQKIIKTLISKGILKRTGSRKKGMWFFTE